MADAPATPVFAEFQPLYVQVKHLLLKRIGSGAWKPGELLPSETELASEYRVSQGTVRKAMMALEADRLIVRRQGRGTFVAHHSNKGALFHFFRLVGLDGQRLVPSSLVLQQCRTHATSEQATCLTVDAGEELHAITRMRYSDDRPVIFERIFVPVVLMPELAVGIGTKMDDEMYVIYEERFGISISRASEHLAAMLADAEEARLLGLEVGAPLLRIERVARDVNGRPVELRVSQCSTEACRYTAEVY